MENTPKWTVDEYGTTIFEGKTRIAMVFYRPPRRRSPGKDKRANARLIAAAPELLEALIAIKALLSEGGEYSICRTDKENMWLAETLVVGNAFEKADIAIEKARGEG